MPPGKTPGCTQYAPGQAAYITSAKPKREVLRFGLADVM